MGQRKKRGGSLKRCICKMGLPKSSLNQYSTGQTRSESQFGETSEEQHRRPPRPASNEGEMKPPMRRISGNDSRKKDRNYAMQVYQSEVGHALRIVLGIFSPLHKQLHLLSPVLRSQSPKAAYLPSAKKVTSGSRRVGEHAIRLQSEALGGERIREFSALTKWWKSRGSKTWRQKGQQPDSISPPPLAAEQPMRLLVFSRCGLRSTNVRWDARKPKK